MDDFDFDLLFLRLDVCLFPVYEGISAKQGTGMIHGAGLIDLDWI